jgi:hypothetical protein
VPGAGSALGASEASDAGMTRKRFLWVLGAGGAALAAEFLVPARAAARTPSPDAAGSEPRLHPRVSAAPYGEGLALRLPEGEGSATCFVNGPGAEVVRRLDGRTSVSAIARDLAPRDGTVSEAEVEARVACFVAGLAEHGFLCAPYYALIAERVERR